MILGLINEIQQYLDARYIGPPEAAWQIFGHHLHAEVPTVVHLALHLPEMHRVLFNPNDSLEMTLSIAAQEKLTLTVFESKGTIFFLNKGAATGKTFLYNTITLKCRSLGHIVVTVASFGIASLLLVGGRTAHSTFFIPLDVLENSVCGFRKQSLYVELFRETKLIIWDEVPMQQRHCVKAVDRTLRDICDSEKPFGRITVVLGGDFRQILPVIIKRVREQIVNALLRHSILWKDLHVLSLDFNMRLNHANLGNAIFAKFLTKIGTNPQEIIKIPSTIHKCQDLTELLSAIYPHLDVVDASTPSFLTERTILSARNDDVSAINNAALNIFSGNTYAYLVADKIAENDEIDLSITNKYPNEYLNSLDPPGLPAFKV
ncbi:ATP-dependent DNA helicase PIF7-like [Camellia sinensis]|uniref:ATP-dependent DNA helicase PIF7-like n=1 Tax=Camellia sinensis TaxID=4442 RepID=UPI001036E831|nr:ATP-dependent DNA helicase PIF7-like [Camellia sinensis]